MISIVIAMRSLWACKILNGDKKIEVRKGLALYNALKKAEERGEEVEFLMYVTKAKPYLDYIEQYDDDSGYWYQGEYHLDHDKLKKLPKPKKGMTEDDPLFDDYTYNDMVLSMRKARKDGSLYSEHYYNLNGKVVARFKAKAEVIEQMEDNVFEPNNYQTETLSMQELLHESRLEYKHLDAYLKGEQGTALHIKELEIFDKPKELGEFVHPLIGCSLYCDNNLIPSFCRNYCSHNTDDAGSDVWCDRDDKLWKPLDKAPQSWCYAEERKK